MKDYEFLRWMANVGTGGHIILANGHVQQLRAIANQIEWLSNTPVSPESRGCELTCGHYTILINPKIGETRGCHACHKLTTVAKIRFKESTPTKRLCVLSCGHRRFIDNPHIGLHISCPICPGHCQRVITIDPSAT